MTDGWAEQMSTDCNLISLKNHFRTGIYQRSIGVNGPRLWDSIPYVLQVVKSLGSFKNNLTSYLLDEYD